MAAAQASRGILPSETLNALDLLVDRLNSAATASGPLPVRSLLVGTSSGVGLSRSLGTAHTARQMQNPNFSHSGSMSEEVLSSVETVWATLVSATPPHVMAAAASSAAGNGGGTSSESEEKKDDSVPAHIQPPHPLLSPLQMGEHVKTVTASFDNCTLIHVHFAPLVVTFVTLPDANIGMIRDVAIPSLKVLLEPVRRALVRSRGGGTMNQLAHGGQVGLAPMAPGQTSPGMVVNAQMMPQQMQYNPQPIHAAQTQSDLQMLADPALQQQLYHQQYHQQQLQQQGYQ
ncbi:hypothetical protein THAOC_05834 [Thalassiosira oceanica]|uniref:Uncharacterized protein n=1 Tax=Thalassiosira oceanica TaxID=159749 RepID=K0TG79_THAOC|nr:hypothetical protein THAOC_05834 [Thalassiosira oceanica]|mmetsp:Transcript_35576/g.84931  ORF Transcript_35576/g.84931 Transcript_35576/m.84931 type:complete len:287 (+) Transcript_35576:107-967(+)|eukprot:EJK72616.1 hypothetical protein THAOC_05834 [Thalassiosira oceanica]